MPDPSPSPGRGLAAGTRPDRWRRVAAGLSDRGLAAAVLVGHRATAHLAGFWGFRWNLHAVVVPAGKGGSGGGSPDAVLVVPREELKAGQSALAQASLLVAGRHPSLGLATYNSGGLSGSADPVRELARAILDMGVTGAAGGAARSHPIRLGMNGRHFPAALAASLRREGLPGAEFEDVDPMLQAVRAVKDPDELAKLARAAAVTLRAQKAVERSVAPGLTELEAELAARGSAFREAGEATDFYADMLSGPNASFVGGPALGAGNRALEEGDYLLSDLCVRLSGYWGDTTRTLLCGGDAAALCRWREDLAVLEESRQVALRLLKPGVRCSEIDRAVREFVSRRRPSASLPHFTGHGVGVDIGEDPWFWPWNDQRLEEGMVFTIEHGFYEAGRYGLRLEDMYFLGPAGAGPLPAGPEVS